MNSKEVATLIIIIWNIIVYAVYGIDKQKSKKSKRRIRESTLITLAFLFGGCGAFAGMSLLHHKTKHIKFRTLIPAAVIVNAAVLYFIFKMF